MKKEFCIIGRVDGCPLWKIKKNGDKYTMGNGYFNPEFDNLRLPLELLHKTIKANIWKDTLEDAVRILGGQENVENLSRQELIDYLMKF